MEGVMPKRVELKCRDMPMDYDDSEFNIHNVELAEEGSSTISPVLRPYDYEDGGNLSFDSLVENEVFLGITGQEDNQWIEEYSRGTNSSVVESRHANAWSEATSSESVEMLIKSVGQGTLVTESSDEPGCLATNMDPNLKQDDENNWAQETMVTNKEEEGPLANAELVTRDEPGSLSIYMDPVFKQDDENKEEGALATETTVTNKEEGALATEDLDGTVEPGCSSIDMDPIFMQDDENNHAQEAIVTNKEEEGALATEELDAGDEVGSLTINMDPNLKQDVENNQAQETLVTNKEEEEALATEELDVSVEHGSLSVNMELFLKQDDENNQAEEATVSNKEEEGVFATEELDVSDEPDSLTINMDSNLRQDVRNNNAQEATVTNGEVEPLVTEVLDESDDSGKLTTNMDPDLKQDDGNKYAHEVMIATKYEGAFATEELDVSDEPDSLTINTDLKEDDENKHAREAMITNEEVGAIASEELDASDDSGDLTTNMDPILKQDDGNNYAHKAMVTNEEVGALVTDKLVASDYSGYLTTKVDPILKQDDGNNVAMIINKTEDHFSGCNVSFEHQKVIVTVTEDSQELSKVSGVELDSDVLVNKCDLLEEREEGAFTTEELDASDELGCLALNMDPNLTQDDENNHAHEEVIVNKTQDHFSGSNTSFEFQMGAINKDSQEDVKVSGIELNSDFLASKCDLAVELSEKVDGICDDLNHVAKNIAVESSENKLQDLSISKIECVNMDASKEFNLKTCPSSNGAKCSTKNMDNPICGHTGVETCTNSVEDPLNVESLDKPPFEVDIPNDEESMPGRNCNLILTVACAEVSRDNKCSVTAFSMAHELNNDLMDEDLPSAAVEDDNKTKSENLASLESNVCSPSMVSDVPSSYAEESEKPESVFDASEMGEISRIIDVGTNMTKTCSSAELHAGNTDLVATPEAHSGILNNKDQSPASKQCGSVQQQVNDEIQSSKEDGGMCIDHDVTFHEEGNTRVSLDMDIAALDGPKNVESISSAEGCKAQGSEADVTILVEPGNVATVIIDAKSSPIFGGIGSVCIDNEKKEEGYVSDRVTCENESIRAASSMVDCATLSVVETGASPDSVEEIVHGTSVENTNAIMNELAQKANPDGLGGCSTPSSIDPMPSDSPAKVGDIVEAGGGIQESFSGHHVNMSSEQHASSDVVLASEYDDSYRRHEDDSSVFVDKSQSDSSILKTDNTELSQSTNIKPREGAVNESTSLPEATKNVQGKEQYISSNSDMKIDISFTFDVAATAGLEETDKALQLFPVSQACNLSTNMEVPCIESSSSTLDPRTPNEATVVTPRTLGSGIILAGSKERKRRRKSVGKESVKKGKETTPIQSGRGKKSSPLLVTPPPPTTSAATDHVIQFQELRPNEKVECSVTKPAAISNLPDLNNATCIFHQPFTNNQQVQLRAQILVYGSLISGMPPEEIHMIAAFGQSDAGRKTWEAAWYAFVERFHGQKSKANTPAMPQAQPQSDVGHRNSTPVALSPLISVSSPLWNMSTPSYVGFQSRSPAFQQSFTPIHPSTYQTPPNPVWLSHSHPFLGQWGVASSPALATHRFSGLPITEAVKLTPVKVSGIGQHAYSMPVVDNTVLSSGDSKSRKRKKVAASVSSGPSQVMMTPPVAHLAPHNFIPLLVENQTDSVTAPVVTSVFSTSVTVSTPPGRFLSVHDHLRLENKAVGSAKDLLKKVDEGNVQEADVNATRTSLPSSESGSIRRTRVTSSPAFNKTPVSTPASAAISYLPQVLGSEISLLTQNPTVSATAPVFCSSFPTSVVMSTPVASTSDSSPTNRFLAGEETLGKVKESTLLAKNAALVAAAEVSNCHDVWSRLDSQNNAHVVSDAESKLMSSIAAAAAVGKMASAAAKFASNIAEHAKLMADEVFLSNKSENINHISHPFLVNKATPASSLKIVDKTTDNHPNPIISAAREAARRRIEAASAASKHAENLDAIVKAAELAAEAVLQVGKIVVMRDPSALRKLAEAGPKGFWKVSQLAYAQHQGGEVSGLHLNGNIPPVNLAHNQIMMVMDDSSVTCNEKDTSTSKVSDLSKAVGVSTKTNTGSPRTYVVGPNSPRITPAIWEEHNIKEGSLVEIYKEDGKYKGAWLAASVLSLKDEKALVCYTGIQSSDGGSEKLKDWVSFEVEGGEAVPRIRIAHPMTTMLFEGARKRRRTAVTDYSWSKGDRVDVWTQDCWREGVVMEPNKIDVTSLIVQFSAAQGETSVVRSWHVRPALIWKDRKWIEWNGNRASQDDMPTEKRMKLGSPDAVNDKRKDKLPMIVEPGRHEEQGTLLPLLSAHESRFNFGKTTTKHTSNLRTIKERAGVVFGVPKPGKKQKFMDVSTQYVDDRTKKSNATNGSFKFSKPPGARVLKNDVTKNQVTQTKPILTSRKPPVPVFRTMNSRDSERTDVDSVENSSSCQNQAQVGSSSSNKSREPAKGLASKKGLTITSKPKSENFNRGNLQLAPKVEVKDRSNSQVNEPRRSNRKIQPTSRLLEGIQSSITVSKIPSVSHASQRKVTSKGNANHA